MLHNASVRALIAPLIPALTPIAPPVHWAQSAATLLFRFCLFSLALCALFAPPLGAQTKKKLSAKLLQIEASIPITKLDALSSPFRETNLTLTPDGNTMYFMSERGGQPWSQFDDALNRNDGDIWVARRVDGVWQRPKPLSDAINTAYGEDEPNVTPDGQNIYFQSFRNGWEGMGGPYFMAELHGDKWEDVRGLGGALNAFFVNMQQENGGSIATDGSSMSPFGNFFMFTCGKDLNPKTPHNLYIARRLADGSFSGVELSELSGKKNERSVFIAADGKSVYFSSTSYGGLGGLDIFKATLNDDGSVAALYNLGEPFNSKSDDYGFIISADGREAFFIRDGDIYSADLSAVESRELKPAPITLLSGKIVSKAGGKPLEASIDLAEVPAVGTENNPAALQSLAPPTTIRSNALTGEFTAIVKPFKKYELAISASKHKGVNTEITISADKTADGVFSLTIALDTVPPRAPKNKTLASAGGGSGKGAGGGEGNVNIPVIGFVFFKTNEFTIEEQFLDELDKAWEFLRDNPSYQAEISGYADDRGSYEYNLRLSQRRVAAVVDYLWSLGCDRKRLALKFFGEEEPIADNASPEGRSQNRRVEIQFFRKAEDLAPALPAPKNPTPNAQPQKKSPAPANKRDAQF
jgi:outer membrane protein OmpA-like peptidoglycan-associated protein/Tol biopolymer transport system component